MSEAVTSKSRSPMLIAGAVSLAAFMEVLDTTIANVALSHISGSLGATSEESTWVLTSYLVANGIILPLSGWLSSVFGRKNFFLLCILGFTITSFLCGIDVSANAHCVSYAARFGWGRAAAESTGNYQRQFSTGKTGNGFCYHWDYNCIGTDFRTCYRRLYHRYFVGGGYFFLIILFVC